MAKIISLDIDGSPTRACLAEPPSGGPHPGILVAHHQEGLSPFTQDLVDKLAVEGYVAICPDHYHYCAPDADLATRRASLRDSRILRDLGAALDYLKNHPMVQKDRLAIIGHCMGGRAAFMGAGAFPAFCAAVVFYSSGMFMSRGDEGPTPFESLYKVRCPVIGFFGGRDKLIPLEQVDRIEAELTRCGVAYEFHRYPKGGHAFSNFGSVAEYRPGPTQDSWRRTVEFLARHLSVARNTASVAQTV